jgi:AraC family transcriptional regulator
MMTPRFETLQPTLLVGMYKTMSIANNSTQDLWQSFMSHHKTISNRSDAILYSVEVYPSLAYFKNFNPQAEFQKWAAVAVQSVTTIPENMQSLELKGDYVVFTYKGLASEVYKAYQFIYSEWLPASKYELCNRPHFSKMDSAYNPKDPNSQEDLWIPVKLKE